MTAARAVTWSDFPIAATRSLDLLGSTYFGKTARNLERLREEFEKTARNLKDYASLEPCSHGLPERAELEILQHAIFRHLPLVGRDTGHF